MVPIEQGRYEADDLIATYTRQARQAGADVLIVSADKDLMQLVEPCVSMYDPASGQAGAAGSREERRLRRRGSREYFEGVGPDKVVDVQALAGDFDRQRARRARYRRLKTAGSSFSNMVISRRCSPVQAKSNSQAARSARRSRNRQAHQDLEAARNIGSRRAG